MKPIIFNTEMVKAILDGRKTSFRLPIKLKDNSLICTGYIFSSTDRKRNDCYSFGKNKEHDLEYIKPKYKVHDILYVKETSSDKIKTNGDITYKADWKYGDGRVEIYDTPIKWKPSVHMPKKYARIFLKVTNARVERLQDISNDDIYSESIKRYSQKDLKKAFDNNELQKLAKCLKLAFINLWNSTAKDGYKWEDNPDVFVCEFERVKKNEI